MTLATNRIDINSVRNSLQILVDQAYISRDYDISRRLVHEEAVYSLLPPGLATVRNAAGHKLAPAAVRAMQRIPRAPDGLKMHWLTVLGIYCRLKSKHGQDLRAFTWSELAAYSYMPSPPPDLYLRLGKGKQEREYFLELLDQRRQLRFNFARIQALTSYLEEGDWEVALNQPSPKLMLICESNSYAKRLESYIESELDMDDEDLPIVCELSSIKLS